MKPLEKHIRWIRNHTVLLVEGSYLLMLFILGQLPLRDFDIWFHVKSGEVFVNNGGLQYTEVFSYAAAGREWIPFEWFFQVIVYYLSLLGFWIIPPFIAVFVVMTHFFLLRIFSAIFALRVIPRVVLSFVFFVSTYEYYTARPHVLAYAFLTITLYLIFARYFQQKRWLKYSPLIVLVWTNVHSTGFLGWGLMLAFALISFFQWFLTKKPVLLEAAKDFSLFAGVNFFITLLPPVGILDYKLLWHFFSEREFLGYFIAEWTPTYYSDNPLGFFLYILFTVVASLVFILFTLKKRSLISNLWSTPFFLMGIAGYTATRNVFPGLLGMMVLLAWNTQQILSLIPPKLPKVRVPPLSLLVKYSLVALTIATLLYYVYLLTEKQKTVSSFRLYFPVQSTEFVKRYLTGNMFNDYSYGGYMLYHLYPEQKVFIDGRADVYLCCEMREYLLFTINKKMPDTQYQKFLNTFWEKYQISFAVISTQKHNVMRKISRVLNNDPMWALVFWDDDSQVFVRKDGKNTEVLQHLETKAATPYLRDIYRPGKEEQALIEYQRMEKISQSARTLNAIGYLLMLKGSYKEAKSYFEKAMAQDPTFESPYMNLAELAVKDQEFDTAIGLYYKAQNLANDRGLIYIRLGQLLLEHRGDRETAKKVWELGAKLSVDDEAKKKLTELVATL